MCVCGGGATLHSASEGRRLCGGGGVCGNKGRNGFKIVLFGGIMIIYLFIYLCIYIFFLFIVYFVFS